MTSTFSTDDIDQRAWRDLLQRNWMTHDAMWFGQATMRHGIEVANDLNCAAVRGMAAVETRRICRLVGLDPAERPEELRAFVDAAIALVIPGFMTFEVAWSDDERSVTFHTTRCFAHDGVEALGVVAEYRCGIFERVYGWLDALGFAYDVDPSTPNCIWSTSDGCSRTITLRPSANRGPAVGAA